MALMRDSDALEAERQVQRPFRKFELLQLLALAAAILLCAWWLRGMPDRYELGWRQAVVEFSPAKLDPRGFGELRLAGAWTVTSTDRRFGGVSALKVVGDDLLGVSDSGVVIRFAKPRALTGGALIGELPDGPADPGFKENRDSEALVADPMGRGWWVAFENRNQLWLYDSAFGRALGRIAFAQKRWPRNRGIEGAAASGDTLLLFPEDGDAVIEVRGKSSRTVPIGNPVGRIADAARLPSSELLVINRRLTPLGFSCSLAVLERNAAGYRYSHRIALGVSRLDNVEALAPERLPGGGIRLWLMTDDNLQRPLRTLLIALDWPATPQPRQQPSSKRRA